MSFNNWNLHQMIMNIYPSDPEKKNGKNNLLEWFCKKVHYYKTKSYVFLWNKMLRNRVANYIT